MDIEPPINYRHGVKKKHFFIVVAIIVFLFIFPFILHTYAHTNELVDLNRIDDPYINTNTPN